MDILTKTARIKIVGVGGAGCNAIRKLSIDKIQDCELLVVNTDQKALTRSIVSRKIHLGNDLTGSYGNPTTARLATERSLEELTDALKGAETIIIVTGLGGGTGSGASPVIAKLAKQLGAVVVAVVTLPFIHEGPNRQQKAMDCLALLEDCCDVVLRIPNENINVVAEVNRLGTGAFAVLDDWILQGCVAVADLFAHKKIIQPKSPWSEVLNPRQRIWMGVGTGSGENRFVEVCERAFRRPMAEELKLTEATQISYQVVSRELTLDEFNRLNGIVRTMVPQGLKIDASVAYDEGMAEDELRLSVWAVGSR
jgi:cell division protein FtsZ